MFSDDVDTFNKHFTVWQHFGYLATLAFCPTGKYDYFIVLTNLAAISLLLTGISGAKEMIFMNFSYRTKGNITWKRRTKTSIPPIDETSR